MKLKLRVLIWGIIVLAIYIPAVRAQANLSFGGGNGTPFSMTLQTPVRFTLTSACKNPFPVIKATGNTLNGAFLNLTGTGTMTFSINGGAARPFTVIRSGVAFGDLGTNDIFMNYPSGVTDPVLPVGTSFLISLGTITTNNNVAGAPPLNGVYTTFLVCSDGGGNLRTSTNALPPTAAGVGVSGRVLNNTGSGLANAVVSMTGTDGSTLSARTNAFGYYRFEDVPAGETRIFTVKHKSYTFAEQIVSVSEQIEDLNFTPEP